MKHLLAANTLLLILESCSQGLSDKELAWIPYNQGDILVFETSDHTLDSFYISGVTRSHTNENEIVEVNCEYLETRSDHDENADTVHTFIMAITEVTNNDAVLTLNLSRKFAIFAPFYAKRLTHLDSLPATTIKIGNKTYDDVLALGPDSTNSEYVSYATDSTFVNKLYWSKSEGLIRYDLANAGTIWNLKRKYNRSK